MTIVEAAEVCQRLTMPVCIDLMRTSLRELEAGNYTQPLRSIALLPGGEKFGFMPACLGDCFGAKVLSAFPQNAGTKYPSHSGSTRTVSLGRHDRCAGYPFRDRL